MRNPSTCELPSSFVSLWRLEATYEESKHHLGRALSPLENHVWKPPMRNPSAGGVNHSTPSTRVWKLPMRNPSKPSSMMPVLPMTTFGSYL